MLNLAITAIPSAFGPIVFISPVDVFITVLPPYELLEFAPKEIPYPLFKLPAFNVPLLVTLLPLATPTVDAFELIVVY